MTDLHVSYPSDDGDDGEGVPTLHILGDDQGDLYVSVGGQQPGWTAVRLCGSNGGGAADKARDFYLSISMAARALAGDRDGVLRLARVILRPELAKLHRDLGAERRNRERAEASEAATRRRMEAEQRRLEAKVEKLERELAGDSDPFDDPEYQAYYNDCARQCRCSEPTVCAGVLAGGLCDSVPEVYRPDPDELRDDPDDA